MINNNTVNEFLKENGLPEDTGFTLKDSGDGDFIARWDLNIPKPSHQDLAQYIELVKNKRDAIKMSVIFDSKDFYNIADYILSDAENKELAKPTLDKYNIEKDLLIV